MWSKPFSSMKPANTCDIGRMAHRPFQTKNDAAVRLTIAKISNEIQMSKVKIGSKSVGYFSRIARTIGLNHSRKPVNASSVTWMARAIQRPIHASQ